MKPSAWWVWSDTHFGHQNIVKFQQRPVNHEVIMLSGWCKTVGEDDVIVHLGDVFMGSSGNARRWASVIRRMPGRKILVLGNHDHLAGAGLKVLESAGFEIRDPFVQHVLGQRVAFTHRPLSEAYFGGPESAKHQNLWSPDQWDVNIHGHVHLNTHHIDDGLVYPDKKYVNVSVEAIDFAPRQVGGLL